MSESHRNEPELIKVGHRIVDHLAHHEGAAAIFHELHHLREYDANHGGNFHTHLATINQHLARETAARHLPSITIVEHGKELEILSKCKGLSARESKSNELPAAVRHAMQHAARHDHRYALSHNGRFPGGGRFAISANHQQSGADWPERVEDSGLAGDQSPSKSGFGEKLLQRLGLPVTAQNMTFLDAWQRAEGGSKDNPFNTTQSMNGHDRVFNSFGVKRYDSIEVGVEATARTLQSGLYNGILRSLKRGDDAHGTAQALSMTPWGTGLGVTRLV